MHKPQTTAKEAPLPVGPTNNPWFEGQKQIMPAPKLPGWLSLILLAPFRLAYGLLVTFSALNQATGGEEESDDGNYKSYDLDAWARERGYRNIHHYREHDAWLRGEDDY